MYMRFSERVLYVEMTSIPLKCACGCFGERIGIVFVVDDNTSAVQMDLAPLTELVCDKPGPYFGYSITNIGLPFDYLLCCYFVIAPWNQLYRFFTPLQVATPIIILRRNFLLE